MSRNPSFRLQQLLIPLACVAGLLSGASARAQTANVTSVLDDGGSGTLRHVIEAAAPETKININVPGTLTLDPEKGELLLDKTLFLTGPPDGSFIIDGGNATRVMHVTAENRVILTRITLTGGKTEEFGIGGGILNEGSLVVNNCTLAHNSAGQGGAIFYRGQSLTVNRSTLTDNTALEGGAIHVSDGPASVSNSTLAANTADFGGEIYTGVDESITVDSSIVANSPHGGDCHGNILSGGHNLSSDTTCFDPSNNDPTDLINTDPRLKSLVDNGGPTPTMMPQPDSPAVDAIDLSTLDLGSSIPAIDQRGFSRVVNTRMDIGAVEFVNHPPAVKSEKLEVDGAPLNFSLNGSDFDGDSIFFALTLLPEHGLLSGSIPDGLIYTPYAGFNGADKLQFLVDDGKAFASGAMSFTVTNNTGGPDPGNALPGDLNRDGTLTVDDAVILLRKIVGLP